MWLMALGVLTSGLKLFGVSRVAGWEWWLVLSPFAAAAVWWTIADAIGLTRRAAGRRHDRRVQRRRDSQLEALGMSTKAGADSRQSRPPRGSGDSGGSRFADSGGKSKRR